MRTYLKPAFIDGKFDQPYDLVAMGFVSQTTHELGIMGLVNLCVKSYCNNLELGLTGILFFDGLNFGQVMEGRPDVIEERWEVIQRDQRHDNLHVIAKKEITCRNFSNWVMYAPDADVIMMLFPEFDRMIRPIQPSYNGSEIQRVMRAYSVPNSKKQDMRYSLPLLH
jgi:hypothetical protein